MSVTGIARTIFNRYRNVILYGIIGISALLLELSVFYALSRAAHAGIAAANGIAMSLGLAASFALNARLNFKVGDRLLNRFFRFAAVTTLGYFLSTAIILGIVQYLHVVTFAAKLASLPAFFAFQYAANKRFTFQPPREAMPRISGVSESVAAEAS